MIYCWLVLVGGGRGCKADIDPWNQVESSDNHLPQEEILEEGGYLWGGVAYISFFVWGQAATQVTVW